MKRFDVKIWDSVRGDVKFIAWAESYDHAVALYILRYPSTIMWFIEEVD